MPKVSRAAGASNAGGVRPTAVVRVKQVLADEEASHLRDQIAEHGVDGGLPFGAVVEQIEGGEQSSAGSSSEASSVKPPPSTRKSGRGPRKPARTTGSPSSQHLTGGSTAHSTGGVQETNTSENDGGFSG